MKDPTLHIMCELPYSCKTTLTKELVSRFGFEVMSMDMVMDEYSFNPDEMTQNDAHPPRGWR